MASVAGSVRAGTHQHSTSFIGGAARVAGRIFASLSFVGVITIFLFRVVHVNAPTAGFFFLLVILIIATAGGLLESTIASVVAMLCFNYFFLPPIGTLTIADPQNWMALFAFLATSMIASQLSARAKREMEQAVDRRGEMERLYSLSRNLLLSDTERPIAREIVQHIAQLFSLSAVALYERETGETYRAGGEDLVDLESKLHDAGVRAEEYRDPSRRLVVTPVRLGGKPIGALALRGAALSDAALQSLLNLVAIGLERAISQAAVNRAEVARQSEELKSTLLDAIAHEFKTPLTSIKAVTTGLLSEPPEGMQQYQRELIGIADEGADRLSRLVTEAIQLARIEGGTFRVNRAVHFPSSLVAAPLKQMKSLTDGRTIHVHVPEDLPLVWTDPELIQMVVAHLIDNALKYSPAGSPIEVSGRPGEEGVIISVADRGPGIAADEQSRIFEKFYRGKTEHPLKGTGMGLAIAREIIHAQNGKIWLNSKPGEGSEFCFSMPIAPRNAEE